MSEMFSNYMLKHVAILFLLISTCCCSAVTAHTINGCDCNEENGIPPTNEGVVTNSDSDLAPAFLYPDTEAPSYIYEVFDDSEFYSDYSKKLGVYLDGTENKELIMAIDEWFGTPFRMGGCSKYGVDCSCFVKKVYENVYGIELNRTSRSMYYKDLTPVRKEELQEGDILCFKIRGKRISHVGIYLKDDKFVHSSRKRGVMINDLNEKYYKKRFFSGGRAKAYMNLSKR